MANERRRNSLTWARRLSSAVVVPLLVLLGPAGARAGEPRIDRVTPRGGQVGQEVTVVIEGANLGPTARLVVGLAATRSLLTAAPHVPSAGKVAFRFRIQETDAPGSCPLRVRTDGGISNMLLFVVGVYPERGEKEPNDLLGDAGDIAPPVTLNGELGAADRDTFRLYGRKNERLVIEVEARRLGSAIDPTLFLLDGNGRELELADDTPGLEGDCRIDTTFPDDGIYFVRVHESRYAKRDPAFYRLRIGSYDYAGGVFPLGGRRGSEVLVRFDGGSLRRTVLDRVRLDSPDRSWIPIGLPALVDPSSSMRFRFRVGDLPEVVEGTRDGPGAAVELVGPVTVNGRLDAAAEVDRYGIAVQPGELWTLQIEARMLGSLLDAVLRVVSEEGKTLAHSDDIGGRLDPRIDFRVPDGVGRVIVTVEDLQRRGGPEFGYRLTATPHAPGFALTLSEPVVNIPLGGTRIVRVDVERRGYDGAIRLEVANPGQLRVAGGTVLVGQKKGFVSLTAPAEGTFHAVPLVVRGRRCPGGSAAAAVARTTIYLANEGKVPISPWRQDVLLAALTRPAPVILRAPEARPVELVVGMSMSLSVEARREEGFAGEVELQGLSALAGISLAGGKVAAEKKTGTLVIKVSPQTPVGQPGELGVRGVIKAKDGNVTTSTPVFPVLVVAPFTLELADGVRRGRAGATLRIDGKVTRRAPFTGEVEIKLAGLPAGVTATSVKVAGDATGFSAELKLADTAGAGKVAVMVRGVAALGEPKKPTSWESPAVSVEIEVEPAAKTAAGTANAGTGTDTNDGKDPRDP